MRSRTPLSTLRWTVLATFALACGGADPRALSALRSGLTEATIAFQDGVAPAADFSGTSDTYLDERANTSNYGAGAELHGDGEDSTGGGSSDPRVPLLRWDVSALPPGTEVVSARFVLEITEASSQSYTVYALLAPWVESEATWDRPRVGATWNTTGASGASDRSSLVSATFAAPLGSLVVELTPEGVADVQRWVDDPSTNHGWTIQAVSNSDGFVAHSRESLTATLRPRLEVTYLAEEAEDAGVASDGGEGTESDAGSATDAGGETGGSGDAGSDGPGGDVDAGTGGDTQTPIEVPRVPLVAGIYTVGCACDSGGAATSAWGLLAALLALAGHRRHARATVSSSRPD